MYAFTPCPLYLPASGLIWYDVTTRGGRGDRPLRLSIDPADNWPNVWRGEYPLGTGIEREMILRAWAAALRKRLDDALDRSREAISGEDI